MWNLGLSGAESIMMDSERVIFLEMKNDDYLIRHKDTSQIDFLSIISTPKILQFRHNSHTK